MLCSCIFATFQYFYLIVPFIPVENPSWWKKLHTNELITFNPFCWLSCVQNNLLNLFFFTAMLSLLKIKCLSRPFNFLLRFISTCVLELHVHILRNEHDASTRYNLSVNCIEPHSWCCVCHGTVCVHSWINKLMPCFRLHTYLSVSCATLPVSTKDWRHSVPEWTDEAERAAQDRLLHVI